ncbi:MAG: AAA family ATPase, partial [Deltaproteobacteria bacterium]
MKISENLNQIIMAAYAEANVRNHEFVTPEHLLYAALYFDEGTEIIQHCGGDPKNLKTVLAKHLREINPVVKGTRSVQSMGFQNVMERAVWHTTSAQKDILELGDILVSMLDEKESFASFFMNQEGVNRLNLLKYISHGVSVVPDATPIHPLNIRPLESQPDQETRREEPDQSKVLKAFTTELTEKALAGEMDPLIGRDDILERTIQVLCRRFKNNPVHVGEPGVGKTAITEGLAQRIAEGKVPGRLKGFKIYSIDMGSLLAGTRFRGDFEERMKRVIADLQKQEKVILFIDEIHNIVGAGA